MYGFLCCFQVLHDERTSEEFDVQGLTAPSHQQFLSSSRVFVLFCVLLSDNEDGGLYVWF